MSDGAAEAPGNVQRQALRVGLALGAIVLGAVVVFCLGVMEGARVAELGAAPTAAPVPAPAATTPVPPAAAAPPATAAPPDKLTFYDRLSGVAPPALVALPEGQAPAPAVVPAPAPPDTRLPARKPAAPPVAPPVAAVPKNTVASRPAKAASAPSDPAAQIRRLAGKGRFTVQLGAVGDRAAAAETAAQIKRAGFEAVTVMASVKGKILYRIRVGSFPSKKAATQAAGIFRSAYGFSAVAAEN